MRRRVHVSLTEARLFCSHYGWRLPHTWCGSALVLLRSAPSMTVVLGRQGVELRRAGHGRSRVSVGRRARLQGWRHGVPGEECDRWLALPAAAAAHTRGPGGLGQRHGVPAGCFTVRCDGPRRQCEWSCRSVQVTSSRKRLSALGCQSCAQVWQFTDEFEDEHTRAVLTRGGSHYYPVVNPASHWYYPNDANMCVLIIASEPCAERIALTSVAASGGS